MRMYSFSTKEVLKADDFIPGWYSLLAPTSQRRYKAVQTAWFEYCEKAGTSWTKAKEATALAFITGYGERQGQKKRGSNSYSKVSKSTVKNVCWILHSLYQYMIRQGILDKDPFLPLLDRLRKVQTGDKRGTLSVDFECVLKLINDCSPDCKEGVRDAAFLTLLFAGGLRLNEARNLRLCDFRRTCEGTFLADLQQTKAGHMQSQPFPQWAAERIERLIRQRENEGAVGEDYLLVNYKPAHRPDGHITERTAQRLFKRLCYNAGLGNNLSPHAARATFITKLLSDGLDLKHVQEAARHASPMMTARYDKRRFTADNNPALTISFEKKDKKKD